MPLQLFPEQNSYLEKQLYRANSKMHDLVFWLTSDKSLVSIAKYVTYVVWEKLTQKIVEFLQLDSNLEPLSS